MFIISTYIIVETKIWKDNHHLKSTFSGGLTLRSGGDREDLAFGLHEG
jgi:hypothetical protein